MIEIKLEEEVAKKLKYALRLKNWAYNAKSPDFPKYAADYDELIDALLLRYINPEILELKPLENFLNWEAIFFPKGKLILTLNSYSLFEKEVDFLESEGIRYTVEGESKPC